MSNKTNQEPLLIEKSGSGILNTLSSRGFGIDPVELGQTIDPYKRTDKCGQDDRVNHSNYKLKELGFI
jgi:hypothetical protein